MPDQSSERPSPPSDPKNENYVPQFDVRNCMVCGRPMEGRKCKYICRSCGTMIDCSDAY
ncbi:MAG TPA: hypothetical protein VNM14_24525 [Planctomycetota bacterium]|jgi:hypothetical protein|nr:hypothetical protein [Planctomycetota bacterium]